MVSFMGLIIEKKFCYLYQLAEKAVWLSSKVDIFLTCEKPHIKGVGYCVCGISIRNSS